MRDGELLQRDLLDRLAEHFRVIQADVGQQHNLRAKHIRRVVAATKPRFDDRDINSCSCELGKRGSCQRLELGGANLLGGSPHSADRGAEVDLVAIDANSLWPVGDMRRDRRADAEPVREQQRFDRARGRRLAVRSDDVDCGVRVLRLPERFEQRPHPIEPEAVDRPRRQRLDPCLGAERFHAS